MSQASWVEAHKRETRGRLKQMSRSEVQEILRGPKASLAVEGLELDAEQEDLLIRSAQGDWSDAEFDRELRALIARRASKA
jgi:hypothetical protein